MEKSNKIVQISAIHIASTIVFKYFIIKYITCKMAAWQIKL